MIQEQPYWIIVNYKKNMVWKQPYSSFEDAKAEFDYQTRNLKNNEVNINWKIEQRTSYSKIDSTKIESKADEDFKKFN